MNLRYQIDLIRRTKQVHKSWYVETYPDVAMLGMDPVEHYLKYGARMGRNPGKNFDTRFYLETYPDVVKSGLNPLVHYALHGMEEGRARKPQSGSSLQKAESRIAAIRRKLLSLGFTDRPVAELDEILDVDPNPAARALAARELALWHMRAKTAEGWRKALDYISRARPLAPNTDFHSRMTTMEMLCHHSLGQQAAGLAAFDRAGREGWTRPDTLLARANLDATPEDRCIWINSALAAYDIAPVRLLPDDGRPAYDRLTCARALPKVTDGPKVTVLIAAYEAAEMLPTALRSLQEQTWENLEIIVIDDCSPNPETACVAEEFATRDSRVSLIRMPKNGGAYVARNAGLDAATGAYVTIHDADDWSHPKKIETQVRFMEDNPEVMGCTSEQARATEDLFFTRFPHNGQQIRVNVSSFLWRRRIVDTFGGWAATRFGADSELILRIKKHHGGQAVEKINSGPLSFQRVSGSSIVKDDRFGIDGFYYGVRHEFFSASNQYVTATQDVRLERRRNNIPYPIPNVMKPDRVPVQEALNFDVLIASDFRMAGGNVLSCAEELKAYAAAGINAGLVTMYRYDLDYTDIRKMTLEIRRLSQELGVPIVSYGEKATCDLLTLRYPPIMQERQRYVPEIQARDIRVIVNQPPMSDYTAEGVVRYELADCAANIRHYFGKDATWHPIGPLVRDALTTHHADQLHHIHLADEDWHNIIDLKGWSRGPRRRSPRDRLRIGRHSRDSWHKWPDAREDILAAYPVRDDVEVHVLGGAKSPARIIGGVPDNWTVHEFGALHPKDFLAAIDVFVYFAHPDWVESFGRTIIEAMAVGVPVILPEIYRPLFADAALYATPANAVETAHRLHADPAAYDAQILHAQDYVRRQFSYEMHVARLRKCIGSEGKNILDDGVTS